MKTLGNALKPPKIKRNAGKSAETNPNREEPTQSDPQNLLLTRKPKKTRSKKTKQIKTEKWKKRQLKNLKPKNLKLKNLKLKKLKTQKT